MSSEPADSVIIMDDEPTVRSSLVMLLEILGYGAVATRNGDELLDVLKAGPTDRFRVAVLDLTVDDGLGGACVVKEVRRICPEMLLVAASGNPTTEVMRNFADHGFDASLEKPFGGAELRTLLHRLLDAS